MHRSALRSWIISGITHDVSGERKMHPAGVHLAENVAAFLQSGLFLPHEVDWSVVATAMRRPSEENSQTPSINGNRFCRLDFLTERNAVLNSKVEWFGTGDLVPGIAEEIYRGTVRMAHAATSVPPICTGGVTPTAPTTTTTPIVASNRGVKRRKERNGPTNYARPRGLSSAVDAEPALRDDVTAVHNRVGTSGTLLARAALCVIERLSIATSTKSAAADVSDALHKIAAAAENFKNVGSDMSETANEATKCRAVGELYRPDAAARWLTAEMDGIAATVMSAFCPVDDDATATEFETEMRRLTADVVTAFPMCLLRPDTYTMDVWTCSGSAPVSIITEAKQTESEMPAEDATDEIGEPSTSTVRSAKEVEAEENNDLDDDDDVFQNSNDDVFDDDEDVINATPPAGKVPLKNEYDANQNHTHPLSQPKIYPASAASRPIMEGYSRLTDHLSAKFMQNRPLGRTAGRKYEYTREEDVAILTLGLSKLNKTKGDALWKQVKDLPSFSAIPSGNLTAMIRKRFVSLLTVSNHRSYVKTMINKDDFEAASSYMNHQPAKPRRPDTK